MRHIKEALISQIISYVLVLAHTQIMVVSKRAIYAKRYLEGGGGGVPMKKGVNIKFISTFVLSTYFS